MVKLNKFENFENALKRLNEMNTRYKSAKSDQAVQDSLTKRFEFTFDLAWKSLREFLLSQGIDAQPSPRTVFTEAYRGGFLQDDIIWIDIMNARNSTSHIYSLDVASDIAENISFKYCKELQKLSKLYNSYTV